MSDEQAKATLLALGFSDKSVAYTQALIGMSEKIRGYEEALRSAGGTTKAVADRQLTPFAQAMNLMRASLIEAGLALTPMIEQMARLVTFVAENITGILKFSAAFLSIAVIGPKIVNTVLRIADAIKKVTTATTFLQALGGPAAWAKIAVGIALAAGAVAAIDAAYGDMAEQAETAADTSGQVAASIQKLGESVSMATTPLEDYQASLKQTEDAQKAWEKTMADGQRVWEETRTPAEKFQSRMEELKTLLQAGAIDMDTYTRAVAMAKETLDAAADSSERFNTSTATGPRAIQAGTAEASRFISEARFNGRDAYGGQLVDVNRRQLDVLTRIEAKVGAPQNGDVEQVVVF